MNKFFPSAIFSTLLISGVANASQSYSFTNLTEKFSLVENTTLSKLNDSEVIVGTTDGSILILNGNNQTILNYGQAWGINNANVVVGSNKIEPSVNNHEVTWESSNVTDLPTLGGLAKMTKDINEKGQIVGYSYTDRPGFPQEHAALWENGTVTDLGTLPGGFKSFAEAINDHGKIVGASYVRGGGYEHAVVWNNSASRPIDLGTLTGTGNSYAFDINNSNQIVGWSDPHMLLQSYHAVIWHGTSIQDLGSFGGNSQAFAINDNGYAVGYSALSTTSNPEVHAFLWHKSAGMVDLNQLLDADLINAGWSIRYAADINNDNFILAIAENSLLQESAWVLMNPISPIPEPSTYALLLAGLGVIGFVRKL